MHGNEYLQPEKALDYVERADGIPHRSEGEAVLLDFIPDDAQRILDLGTGDGRLLHLILLARPQSCGVALDFSPPMLELARRRFAGDDRVQVVHHDLNRPLPALGLFDAVVSSFAIHHCEDSRKRTLFQEIYTLLKPRGIFCNLEHVASATPALHERFLQALGITAAEEDPSNRLASVEIQLQWLREAGFDDVDCWWKWLELALFGGAKPS